MKDRVKNRCDCPWCDEEIDLDTADIPDGRDGSWRICPWCERAFPLELEY